MNRFTGKRRVKSLVSSKSGAAVVAISVVALAGARVMAADALTIEGVTPTNGSVTVQYDNTDGYDSNGYPVITAIPSQPGSYGGHTYTSWSALTTDQSGSLDLFISQTTLNGLPGMPSNSTTTPPYGTATTSLAVGDGINSDGQWDPFDGIPELEFSTSVTTGNYIALTSTNNTLPAIPLVTIPGLKTATGNGANVLAVPSIAGQYLEIQNVLITPGNGSTVNPFVTDFPTYTQVNFLTANETYTITDGGANSMELFDWVTSYSSDGALGGTPIPTGPVDVYGFYDSFNEFVPSLIVSVPVPEPASFGLLAMGATMLLRRKTRKA